MTAYFADGRGDYYAEGMEVEGWWLGKTAERLGLEGVVGKEEFAALCRNEEPGSDRRLTPRTSRDRRVGCDLTFNCPKSVSVLYGLTGSPEILAAFRESLNETMRELEAFVETRVRRGREDSERRTGNLVAAAFVHDTSRPIDGVPDPHLHCHVVALNVTWDEMEKRYKAADLGAVRRRAPYFESSFHARFASKLRRLGFDIVPTANRWEIAGVLQRVMDAFSRRTAVSCYRRRRSVRSKQQRPKNWRHSAF